MSEAPDSARSLELRIDTLKHEASALQSQLHATENRAEREKKRSITLVWTSQLVNSSLELDVVLRTVIDLAVETMKAERGFLMLAGPDGGLHFAVARNLEQA